MTDEMQELFEAKKAEIQKQTDDLIRGKLGEEMTKETPLEEMRRVQRETKSMLESLQQTEARLQKTAAELALGGYSEAGSSKPVKKSPEQEAREKGEAFARKFLER